MSSAFVLVLTTLPSAFDVHAFVRTLVEERLAACVTVGAEMESVYRWKGAIERDRERQVVIKTTAACLEALEARVGALHPYELPEFLVIPVSGGSRAYLEWIAASTGAGS